jgi:hypothetical protein
MDVFRQKLELLCYGASMEEVRQRVLEFYYDGIEADRELVSRDDAKWYPKGYDPRAELNRRLDVIRDRRESAEGLEFPFQKLRTMQRQTTMIEQEIAKHEQLKAQLVSELGAASTQLKALLSNGSTKEVSDAPAWLQTRSECSVYFGRRSMTDGEMTRSS